LDISLGLCDLEIIFRIGETVVETFVNIVLIFLRSSERRATSGRNPNLH